MPNDYLGRRNLILLATFILCLPALAAGLMGDDYLHYALLNADIPIAKPNDLSLFGLFSFINGDPERNRLLMDYSLIPWWTYDELKYAFWRPLTEIFHWVDHRLWPNSPWLMHLHNILWYIAAVYLVSKLYRKYLPSEGIALLALFLYALDSSHGFTVSWISNRNALIALTFGVITLLTYSQWRESNNPLCLGLSLISMLLALFSAELGISVFGYIGAYALFMDKRGPVKGVLATTPHFILIVAWWIVYKQAGFGAAHADAYYVDPASQPLTFLAKIAERLPVLLGSQWGIIPADLYTLSGTTSLLYSTICFVFLVAVLPPVLLIQKPTKKTWFWFSGMIFCMLPSLAASPYDRLLLFPGIGAAALLGTFLHTLYVKKVRPANTLLKGYTMLVFGLLALLHVVLSPVLLPLMAYSTKLMSDQVSQAPSYFDNIDDIESKQLVLLSPPLASSLAIAAFRFHRNEPMPNRIWTITTLSDGIHYRAAGNTLTLDREEGFIEGPIEESVRNIQQYPFEEGQTVELSGLTISVHDINPEGKPRQLTLQFAEPLSNGNVVLLQWNAESNEYQVLEY